MQNVEIEWKAGEMFVEEMNKNLKYFAILT